MLRQRTGFTLVELVVLLLILAAVVALLVPALAAARRTAFGMQNSTQVRGIHTGLVLFAQGNNGFYPGLNSAGDSVRGLERSDCSLRVECRYQEMLYDNYFAGEYIISPAEVKTPWQTGAVTTAHYSYAMLEVSAGSRRDEWRETGHAAAAIVTDRALANGAGIRSVHTQPRPGVTQWHGSTAFNDNHDSFARDDTLTTRYGRSVWKNDRLFRSPGTDDALLIAAGTDLVTMD